MMSAKSLYHVHGGLNYTFTCVMLESSKIWLYHDQFLGNDIRNGLINFMYKFTESLEDNGKIVHRATLKPIPDVDLA